MDSSLFIPITLWSASQPTFRISSICLTSNFEKLVTGSHEGQICIWDLDINKKEIIPKTILIGHEYSITCLVSTNKFVISSCEGGKLCRWTVEDGYCDKSKNTLYVHRNIQLLKPKFSDDELLFTCGDYSNIFVYHSVTLQVMYNLYSKENNWISNFQACFKANNSVIVKGVTAKGCIKTWHLDEKLNKSQCETHLDYVPAENIVDLKFNSEKTLLLIVAIKCWCLLNSEHLTCDYRVESASDEKLMGGNFCASDSIAIGTNSGKFYIYKEQQLTAVLLDSYCRVSLFQPAMILQELANKKQYFIKCNSDGQLSIWTLNYSAEKTSVSFVKPFFSISLNNKWIPNEKCIFDNIIQFTSVACCIYAFELDRFFLGCLNGKIISLPATQTMLSFYFGLTNQKPLFDILPGHNGKINCLLYPRAKYPHYDKAHLVSGGKDFSVCLWDMVKLELLHKFCIQSGDIIRLIVPPDDCYHHVRNSICSISSDHSVAILNLIDKRCITLTLSHPFPIISLNWRPLDGFLIVECFDGSVFVWEMETGLLDRILGGVDAQEVLYACKESNIHETQPLFNFYICEEVSRKNSMQRELFHTQSQTDLENFPIALDRFLINENSECQILLCNIEHLVKIIISKRDGFTQDKDSNGKLYLLTQVLSTDLSKRSYLFLEKIKSRSEGSHQNGTVSNAKYPIVPETCDEQSKTAVDDLPFKCEHLQNIFLFLLSSLHIWGLDSNLDEILKTDLGLLKPVSALPIGVMSQPGTYSLFLPNSGESTCGINSSLLASTCVIMTVLCRILKSTVPLSFSFLGSTESKRAESTKDVWEELYAFYEMICLNNKKSMPRLKIEILAKAWQSKCLPFRNTIRKLLPSHLETLVQQDYIDLLEFWYRYLPHFKVCGKTIEKTDFDNLDMKTIALVLFGTVGSDLKFKLNPSNQEDYVYQTCSSLVYLLLQPSETKRGLGQLQATAIDFIGRGYIVWEQFLKVEKIFPVLFQMCQNTLKSLLGSDEQTSEVLDKRLSAHGALKAIALARTSAFIKCLVNEINQTGTSPPNRNDGFLIEKSKPEILSIIVFLLEKTPYIMLLYLNEVVSIFVYCIDSTHLKQTSLSGLLPVLKKFRQVHHSVTGQRIAVGLGTGSIVVYDLKSGRVLSTQAHNDSISALKFSEDGRYLASYSCYENRLTFWQVLTGMFGLGPIQIKSTKCYQTYKIHDEEIRNHLEIAELMWLNNKSVVLKLCDGTENVFHA